MSFNINTYYMNCEQIVIDKTNYLEQRDLLTGELRSGSSVIRPTILVALRNLPTFNYVRINAFNRYYFVDNIVSNRQGLWEISLICDVLMTYKDDILNSNAFISRSALNFNLGLSDNMVPKRYTQAVRRIDYDIEEGIFETNNSKNVSFVLTVIGATNQQATSWTDDYFVAPNKDIFSNNTGTVTSYICNKDEINLIFNKILGSSTLASYVISVYAFPLNILQSTTTQPQKENIFIGNTDTEVAGIPLINSVKPVFDIFTLSVSDIISNDKEYFAFYNGEGNVSVELYLPYYGKVSLKMEDLINFENISVKYYVDFQTGECTIYLISGTTSIGTYSFQIGVLMAVNSTNFFENSRLIEAAQTRATSSVLGAILTVAAGIGTGAVIGSAGGPTGAVVGAVVGSIAGGGAQTMSGVASYQSTLKTTHTMANNSSPNGGIENASTPVIAYALVYSTVYYYDVEFAKLYGYNTLEVFQISNVAGYFSAVNIHFSSSNATKNEQDEIVSILASGVINPINITVNGHNYPFDETLVYNINTFLNLINIPTITDQYVDNTISTSYDKDIFNEPVYDYSIELKLDNSHEYLNKGVTLAKTSYGDRRWNIHNQRRVLEYTTNNSIGTTVTLATSSTSRIFDTSDNPYSVSAIRFVVTANNSADIYLQINGTWYQYGYTTDNTNYGYYTITINGQRLRGVSLMMGFSSISSIGWSFVQMFFTQAP